MEKIWRHFFETAILAFMLCLTGLVMSGTSYAQQCVDNGDGTVTDNDTGLMWQKDSAGPMDWDAAHGLGCGHELCIQPFLRRTFRLVVA